MALKLGTLFFDINADTSNLRKSQRQIHRQNGALVSSFKRLGGAIAAAFAFDSIRRLLLLADQIELLDVRTKNMTKTNKEYIRSQVELLRISNNTGTSLMENVRLFEALTIASDDVGAGNKEVLRMVESLRKLGVIGGTNIERMNNSLLQFGQAMAGGKVRAEEFNSIVENTPLIAQAIAKGLGDIENGIIKTVGATRRMVLVGELLSTEVFNSLLGQTEDIEERFRHMPLTIERAFEGFNN